MKLMLAGAGTAWLTACGRSVESGRRHGRVFVVALDGMDPRLVRRLMQAGRLPNFSRLAAMGSFASLATSTPPQTPVAFGNIISGADPGTHQIFDFIHRDPNPPGKGRILRPYSSTSDIASPERDTALRLGGRRLSLSGGEPILMRRGTTFWDGLTHKGVDSSVYYLPANYPPVTPAGHGQFRSVSGMGTPDLMGTYGKFSLYTEKLTSQTRGGSGGTFIKLNMTDHRAAAVLTGPQNHTLEPDENGEVPPMTVPFQIVRDPTSSVAKITVGSEVLLLNEGEWSDWVPLDFETQLPGAAVLEAVGAPTSVPGMVRFYLKQVHPKLELYVTPINIDPQRPALPISTPADFAPQLADHHGRFYTLGIPEDTKALDAGALNEDEFLQQAYLAHDERTKQYHHVLDNTPQGLLCFYFGTTDLVSHMFWRDRDPDHPGRDPAQGDRYAGVIDDLYGHMDELVGAALDQLRDEDTLIVLSDHGFTTFRRAVNLNNWLYEQGYLVLKGGFRPGDVETFKGVDWARTRAYALGLNSLFVNVKGRERMGTVAQGAAQRALRDELAGKLDAWRDDNGAQIVRRVDDIDQRYPGADANVAPDLIVGYADSYRVSWRSVLGGLSDQPIEDNLDRWSGDHCVAADLVPGILLTNRPITVEQPKLCDIAATILAAWQVGPSTGMGGRNLFT